MENLTVCNDLFELTQKAQAMRSSSVLHFNFSLTFLLTTGFMLVYYIFAKDKSILKLLFYGSFFFYLVNVVRLVFFPMPIDLEYISLLTQKIECGIMTPQRHNLELFDFMKWDNLFHITTVGNFILLMPLSVYLPLIFPKHKWTLWRMTLYGLSISMFIEVTQLTYSVVMDYIYRSFDVDDLMLNTSGVFVGYVGFLIVKGIATGLQKIRFYMVEKG